MLPSNPLAPPLVPPIDPIALVDAGLDDMTKSKTEAERADVAKWLSAIQAARKFDEPYRKQIARDRKYARGDSGFAVDANIVGTNIDILESFLYAKDPDVDCMPAKSVMPPTIEAVEDMAEEFVAQSPEVQQAGQAAFLMALNQGLDQPQAEAIAQLAADEKKNELIQQQYDALTKRYARRLRDAKAVAETTELVVSHLWNLANLKPSGRRVVRSGLTVALGVLKGSWQERTAPSPETATAINDLQDNIKRAAAQKAALDDASGDQLDAQLAEYNRQLEALRGEAERVVARGFAIDQVQTENFQVAPGYMITDHLNAPWNAERIPMLKSEAVASFALSKDDAGKITTYRARKPEMTKSESGNVNLGEESVADANDADAYTTAETGGGGTGAATGSVEGDTGDWCMVWEIYDRTSNHVLTLIEGLQRWAKPQWQPTATVRFYPYFIFATAEVDGQRHPQSLVSRASKLIDEYNRIGTNEAEHRRRLIPKMMFMKGQLDAEVMTKIVGATTAEYVGVETSQPGASLANLIFPVPYNAMDPAMYDRGRIMAEIERIFGVQEALSGSVSVAKTAREAEIQQGGFQARTGGRRDQLEWMLLDLARYTAQVAHAKMTPEEVREIAGPDAIWPEYTGPDSLNAIVQIDIRAGSSGKPATSAEREAMAQTLPMLQGALQQVAMLRNSTPDDQASSLIKLLQLVSDRTGDRLDIDSLMPKKGPPPVTIPGPDGQPIAVPTPGAPGMPPGAPGQAPAPDPAPEPAP